MRTARTAIIGGGLSGLYAATLLEQQGMSDYLLIEARDTFGGRLASVGGGIDLGATWYWPAVQPQLAALVQTLGLPTVEQYEAGDMLVDQGRNEPPLRTRGYVCAPPSMRLADGMGALAEALRATLDHGRLIAGQRVRRVERVGSHVLLEAQDARGMLAHYQVDQVLLALPPRVALATMVFVPALPQAVAHEWQATPTWMAPHAKYVAVYERPFWREQGLSGHVRSAGGPLGETHDVSSALFGFFAIPAATRVRLGDVSLKAQCRAQLARLFGPQAATPQREWIQDWAREPDTATPADLTAPATHARAPVARIDTGPWLGVIEGIASEWSPQFPGYVAGAIDAASRSTMLRCRLPQG